MNGSPAVPETLTPPPVPEAARPAMVIETLPPAAGESDIANRIYKAFSGSEGLRRQTLASLARVSLEVMSAR